MDRLKKFSYVLFFACSSVLFISHTSKTQELEINFYVPDTLVSTGANNGLLSIYIDNYNYEIFGFQFVLRSSRPDLVKFNFQKGSFELVSGGFWAIGFLR